jgi:proteasome lid subunit RPN8/RPN11
MSKDILNPLFVPADAIRVTASLLRSMTGREACCFWFGWREERSSVEAIIVPSQQNNGGNYHVTAEAMLQVGNVARERGWKNLAQIHSHPGQGVRHSGYDDEMANSRRALSLVFPNYGLLPEAWRFRGWLWRLWPKSFPADIGVHAFRSGKWAFLNRSDISAGLRITPGPRPILIDLR